MDRMSDYGWIAALIGALGGWKFVEYFLNRKNIQRITAAEVMQKELEGVMKDYERLRRELESLKTKLDEVYKQLHQLEDERLALIRRNNELEIALKEAEKHVCMQPDDKCLRRLGTAVNCRLRDLIRGEYMKDHPGAIITEDDMGKEEKA